MGQHNVQLWVQFHQGHRAAAEDTTASGWLEGWGAAVDVERLGDTTPSIRMKSKTSALGSTFLLKNREMLKGW